MMIDMTAGEDEAADIGGTRKRVLTGRSPNYPFFDLERSVARAKQLFERERNHATPVLTALGHWGYSNPSGKGGMTLSSLKQFGLLDDIGRGESRRVQLSTRAYDILHTPHEEERAQLLRDAALSPEIHQQLWDEYGTTLPSDSSLAWTLTKERGFTTAGAEDFIRQWKRTMTYARLGEGAELGRQDSGTDTGDPSGMLEESADLLTGPEHRHRVDQGVNFLKQPLTPRPLGEVTPVSQGAVQSYPIPIALANRPAVVLSGPFPLSEVEWAQFKAVLDAMKPVLVGDPADSDRPTTALLDDDQADR